MRKKLTISSDEVHFVVMLFFLAIFLFFKFLAGTLVVDSALSFFEVFHVRG